MEMDSTNDAEEARNPHHHHHHLFYISPHCPIHRSIMQLKNHSPKCSFSTSLQQVIDSNPPNPNSIFSDDDATTMQDEVEKPEEEEEDEDPVFVLTDEWREFFAKSEAKRRLAKKQAKKKGKV